jgi:RNA polymerase-binding protein DksA
MSTGSAVTAEQIEHFRQELLEARERAMERIDQAETRARALAESAPADPADPGNESTRDLLIDTDLGVGEMLTREREEIDDALLRIERGEYGVCEVCGRPIELERLEAEPAAHLCREDARRAPADRPPRL